MLCLSVVLQERTYLLYLDEKEGVVKLTWFILCCLWVVNRKCGGILGHPSRKNKQETCRIWQQTSLLHALDFNTD